MFRAHSWITDASGVYWLIDGDGNRHASIMVDEAEGIVEVYGPDDELLMRDKHMGGNAVDLAMEYAETAVIE